MLPTIRTIHHLSCSGGTLISKCLACMPDVALLSEVHPFNVGRVRFNPFDPVQQLFAQGLVEKDTTLLKSIFSDRIKAAHRFIENQHKKLVLRDHTHTDYLMREPPGGDRTKSLISALSGDFLATSVVTIRDPVDSYLSLVRNGWNKGVKSFDDYCGRVLLFLEAYQDIPVYKYEEFCETPDRVLEAICNDLDIQFSREYKERFWKVKLTGDSGRASKREVISKPERRVYSAAYEAEVARSPQYKEIKRRLGY